MVAIYFNVDRLGVWGSIQRSDDSWKFLWTRIIHLVTLNLLKINLSTSYSLLFIGFVSAARDLKLDLEPVLKFTWEPVLEST